MNVFVLILLLVYLTGCGAQNSSAKLDRASQSNPIPWFCQQGVSAESWDCVQDKVLAANPQPTRLPQRKAPAADTLRDAPSAGAEVTAVKTSATDNRAVQKTPASAADTLLASDRSTPSAERKLNLPLHVALSYQPAQPVAIIDLPDEFWAVQLVAVSSKEALEKYAEQNQLAGMSAARISDGTSFYYVLLLGIYETQEKAQKAVASLTAPLAQHDPWIRSLASLQAAMVRANKLANSSEL